MYLCNVIDSEINFMTDITRLKKSQNIIEMTGVRLSGADLFMFEAPHEEVWSVELVAHSDTLKCPIVVSRIG
jgi:uncharacterized protein YciU (UPF0263 family)